MDFKDKEVEKRIDDLIDKYKQQIEHILDLKFSLALEELIPDIFDNDKITFRLENRNPRHLMSSRLIKRNHYIIKINDKEFKGEEVHDIILEKLKSNPNLQWNLPNKSKENIIKNAV